ncbi:EamA family transporter [candidate division TA06 bacterium]|nr:EamA family transporter [candidate division TA06 bacterium]
MDSKYSFVQALLAATLFGLSAPLAKLLLGEIEPVMLAALLYLGCGFGLLTLKLVSRLAGSRLTVEALPSQNDFGWLAGATLVGGVAAPIVMMLSLKQTTAATASLLLNFESIATVLIAVLLFKEAVGRRIWIAVAFVALAGMVLSIEPGSKWIVSAGSLGVLMACVLWGLDNNFTQRISAKDPLVIAMVKGIVAGCASLFISWLSGGHLPGLLPILGALGLGFVSYGLSIYMFILSLRGLGTARTGALFGIAPFLGVVGSIILFGLTLTWQFLAALPLMIFGAYLLLTEQHRHYHTHEKCEHTHAHKHDEHHQHDHTGMLLAGVTHSHMHKHSTQPHEHDHTPDIHHRHSHDSHG